MHSPCEIPLSEYLPRYECQLICMAASTEVSAKIFTVTKSVGIFRSHLHSTACAPVILLHHQNPAAAKHRISGPFWFKTISCVWQSNLHTLTITVYSSISNALLSWHKVSSVWHCVIKWVVPLTFSVKQSKNSHGYSLTAWHCRWTHHDPSTCQRLHTQ